MVSLADVGVLHFEHAVPRSTIRRWAHEGRITRMGRDARGRTLYDEAEVRALVEATRQKRVP